MLELTESLLDVRDALVTLGRLQALHLLDHGGIRERIPLAQNAASSIEGARVIDDFLNRRGLQHPAESVGWHPSFRPDLTGCLYDGRIQTATLVELMRALKSQAAAALLRAKHIADETILYSTWLSVLQSAQTYLGCDAAPHAQPFKRPSWTPPSPRKIFSGPKSVPIDPAFVPTYSVFDQAAPEFGDSLAETVPYLWVLASRECLAAELSALCIIEWDGLPLDFYVDFAKQLCDETTHAIFCMQTSEALMPELCATLDRRDPLYQTVKSFLREGQGLPVPRERNFYEAILNAGLVERLVLMHHDTETPGIANLQAQMESNFCASRLWLAEGISIVQVDERTHSRIGHRWLHYLVPERSEREDAIECARLLRTVLLMTSRAHHGSTALEDLLFEAMQDSARKATARTDIERNAGPNSKQGHDTSEDRKRANHTTKRPRHPDSFAAADTSFPHGVEVGRADH